MTESMKYYESIRRKYPETVSKDQFYQIAHILLPAAEVEAAFLSLPFIVSSSAKCTVFFVL